MWQRRLTADHGEIGAWVRALPQPVAVIYEAGPTGFGWARSLAAAGIAGVVAAPWKPVRPAGDRVKTDARDARRLARLRVGEIVEVTVPGVEQEAARDLVRARGDCRADLVSARHRVFRLLWRRGIVYHGGKPWTVTRERWLRAQRFKAPGLPLATRLPLMRWPPAPRAATVSMPRLAPWPPISRVPRWCPEWGVCGMSRIHVDATRGGVPDIPRGGAGLPGEAAPGARAPVESPPVGRAPVESPPLERPGRIPPLGGGGGGGVYDPLVPGPHPIQLPHTHHGPRLGETPNEIFEDKP